MALITNLSANVQDGNWTSGGSFDNTTSLVLKVGEAGGFFHFFILFPAVAIANGQTITAAKINFIGQNNGGFGETQMGCFARIYASDVDDATVPVDAAELNALSKTTNYTEWEIPVLVDGAPISSPDFKEVIQEIVDRPGWVSGNDILILVKDAGSFSDRYRLFSDYLDTGNDAELETEGGPTEEEGSGGVVCGGTADNTRIIANINGSGGVVCGSSAIAGYAFEKYPSGGSLGDGGGSYAKINNVTTSGGVVCGGTVNDYGDAPDFSPLPVFGHNYQPYRKLLTIPRNTVSSTLTNYPYAVVLTLDPSKVSTPYGITFEDTEENLLHFDLDQYDDDTGQLSAFVRIPSLTPLGYKFYIYYGKASYVSEEVKPWDSNFQAVYHLASDYSDATGNTAGASVGRAPTTATGFYSDCQEFDGTEWLTTDADTIVGDEDITVSCKVNLPGVRQQCFYSRGESFAFGAQPDGKLWASITTVDDEDYVIHNLSSSLEIPLGTWHHVAVVWESGVSLRLYLDAELVGTLAITDTHLAPSGGGQIGRHLGSYNVVGKIDELRLSNTVRSLAWFSAEYSSGGGLTIGPESTSLSFTGLDTPITVNYVWVPTGSISYTGTAPGYPVYIPGVSGGITYSGAQDGTPTFRHTGAGGIVFAAIGGPYTSGWDSGYEDTSSATPYSVSYNKTGSGSMIYSGTAPGSPAYVGNASGSITFGGAAPVGYFHIPDYVAIVYSGSASGKPSYKGNASGSISYSGTAAYAVSYAGITGSGSLIYSGTAPGSPAYVGNASGSITFSGSKDGKPSYIGNASGSISYSGTATASATYDYSHTGSGTITYSGVAPVATVYNAAASGSISYYDPGNVGSGPYTSGWDSGYGDEVSHRRYSFHPIWIGSGVIVFYDPPALHLDGDIEVAPLLSGRIICKPRYEGEVVARPLLVGTITTTPIMGGEVSSVPVIAGVVTT